MENTNQQDTWDDIKNAWNISSDIREINIAMTELIEELKDWASPFEQDAIKKDVILIKGSISQFEKDAIKKDITMLEHSISQLEKGFVKSTMNFIVRVVKKVISKVKVKDD